MLKGGGILSPEEVFRGREFSEGGILSRGRIFRVGGGNLLFNLEGSFFGGSLF